MKLVGGWYEGVPLHAIRPCKQIWQSRTYLGLYSSKEQVELLVLIDGGGISKGFPVGGCKQIPLELLEELHDGGFVGTKQTERRSIELERGQERGDRGSNCRTMGRHRE